MPQFVLTETIQLDRATNYTPQLVCHLHAPIFCVSKDAFFQMLHINVNSKSCDFGFHRLHHLWKKFLIGYVCKEQEKIGAPLTEFFMETHVLIPEDQTLAQRSREFDEDLFMGDHKLSDKDRKEFYEKCYNPAIENASRKLDLLIEPLQSNFDLFLEFASDFSILQI